MKGRLCFLEIEDTPEDLWAEVRRGLCTGFSPIETAPTLYPGGKAIMSGEPHEGPAWFPSVSRRVRRNERRMKFRELSAIERAETVKVT